MSGSAAHPSTRSDLARADHARPGAVGSYLGFTKAIPFRPYEIKAAFASPTTSSPGSPVRIAGVEVGKVKSVEPRTPAATGAPW